MILHTVLPEQCVLFPELAEQPQEFVEQGNAYFGVCRNGAQETLCRLVSTNPRDYLNPQYAPGVAFIRPNQSKTFEESTSFRV